MQHYYKSVTNQITGAAIEGATVTVYLTGTGTKANLFSDDGVTPTSNPIVTDSHGIFNFYVADGRYDIQVQAPNFGTYIYQNVEIADVTEKSTDDAAWNVRQINVDQINAAEINGPVGGDTPAPGIFTDIVCDTLTVNGFDMTPNGSGLLPVGRLGTGAGGGSGSGTNVLYDDQTFKPAPGGAVAVPPHTIVSIGPLSGADALPTARVLDPTDLPVRSGSFLFVIDGGGAPVTTGVKGQVPIPVGCTVSGWEVTADRIGSAVIDVLRSTYAAFPTTASIAGSDLPTLAAAIKGRNLGPLTNWGSTDLAAQDEVQFSVISAVTVQKLFVTLFLSIPYA